MPDIPTTTKRCGSCAEYWSLEGDSILPEWGEPDRAGTCRWSTFRLFTDEPIMNCWSAKSHG